MIKIHFSKEPDTDNWKTWRTRCQKAQDTLDESHRNGTPKEATDHYKEMRLYLELSGPFFGKCAYCESRIAESQPGDIDHYRPKGRVQTADNQSVMVTADDGTQKPHPGYYWLAYHWQNLLPACADCNRPSSKKTGGQRIGKWDQFPIAGGSVRATKAGEEDRESPLLLNPTNPDLDLDEHLEIDDTGILTSTTLEGKTTIEMLGLNREGLLKTRVEAFWIAYDAYTMAMLALLQKSQDSNRHLKALAPYEEGSAPFAMAGRAGIGASIREAVDRQKPLDEFRKKLGL